MPSLEKLHKRFRQDPFVLLAVDVGEDEQTVKRFVEKNGLSFPVLLDSDSTVAARYGVRAHPVAYFIDAEGNLVSVVQGYRKWDSKDMKTLLASLMPGRESM